MTELTERSSPPDLDDPSGRLDVDTVPGGARSAIEAVLMVVDEPVSEVALASALELPVDTDAYNSVGGYVFGELGRLPRRGDSIRSNGYTIRVESVRENRIEAVRISGSVRSDA